VIAISASCVWHLCFIYINAYVFVSACRTVGSLVAPVAIELLRSNREQSLRRLLLSMGCTGFAFYLAAFQVRMQHHSV
jgi:hypothetical protein